MSQQDGSLPFGSRHSATQHVSHVLNGLGRLCPFRLPPHTAQHLYFQTMQRCGCKNSRTSWPSVELNHFKRQFLSLLFRAFVFSYATFSALRGQRGGVSASLIISEKLRLTASMVGWDAFGWCEVRRRWVCVNLWGAIFSFA